MEYSLHRQLKQHYAVEGARQEVPLERFRIDVVTDAQLVEIQHGSLAAIQRKVGRLIERHRVLVVKPLVTAKAIVKRSRKNGPVTARRKSPKRASPLDAFHELVHFTRAFPHPNLELELVFVEIEEWRYPGHGRRRRWRAGDHVIEDQKLARIVKTRRLRTAADLVDLAACELPDVFHTADLASALQIDRWLAQRIAYCWRETGAAKTAGKSGNTLLYTLSQGVTPSMVRRAS